MNPATPTSRRRRAMVFAAAAGLLLIALIIAIIFEPRWLARWRGGDGPSGPLPRFAAATTPPIDLARLEHDLPLTPEERATLSPEQLPSLTQEQLDQIYARLTAGVIPDGAYDGRLLFPRGADGVARVTELVSGRVASRLAGIALRDTERLAHLLWQGKVFERGARLARSRIDDPGVLASLFGDALTAAPRVVIGGRSALLVFPGRVYCGQSLLDGRRESIVMDYQFGDELPGYREHRDWIVSRHGLGLREEMRAVRPGFYLGRVYSQHIFVANLVLVRNETTPAEKAVNALSATEDCWPGEAPPR